MHYFWHLSHDCHVIAFLCSTLTSWHSLSAKASIVTLSWTYLTDYFSCNSNSHLFHYFSLASLSRAVSTMAAFHSSCCVLFPTNHCTWQLYRSPRNHWFLWDLSTSWSFIGTTCCVRWWTWSKDSLGARPSLAEERGSGSETSQKSNKECWSCLFSDNIQTTLQKKIHNAK